ncbi:MAG: hypothetical protein ACP5JG_09150 [Anaerolineae bacterium]
MADARMLKLVPGTPLPPHTPFTRYRTPHIAGVARPFIESTTRHGDLVLHVNTTGGGYVTEILAADRRTLAINLNPIALLWSHLDLNPVPVQELEAALTRLGDTTKGGAPLISHLREVYASRCPLCKSLGVAAWFAWDREAGQPYAKRVRCKACNTSYEGPVDDQDLAAAGDFPVDSGPAYHLALSRAAPSSDALRPRVAGLVQLYTPRNLSVLMDILYRLPRIDAPLDTRRMLTGLVLDALDRGCSLSPESAPDERPRTLRTPQKFLERNIWMLLEDALDRYRANVETTPRSAARVGMGPAATFPQLLVSPEPNYLLLARSIQSLKEPELEGHVRSLIFQIEPPDAPFLALSALWSAWLWGEEAPAGLHSFLGRRRLDWEWYEHSMTVALRQVRRLLHPEASMLLITLSDQSDLIRTIVGAVDAAGLRLDRWIAAPPNGCRLVVSQREPKQAPRTRPGATPTAAYVETCREILRRRGEPMRRQQLETWCTIDLGRSDVPELDPTTTMALTEIAQDYVWLASATDVEDPLADRVEQQIVKHLGEEDKWSVEDLIGEIYRTFTGALSPDPEFVGACIQAYARALPDGTLQLRAADEPANRRAQAQKIRSDIKQLGSELGYNVSRRLRGDIVWREDGRRVYAFRCTTNALLAPHLLKSPPPTDGRRCLILPDSHADLVALKLARDPRMRARADQDRWTFLKFGQAERMVREAKEPSDIEMHLGLGPGAEQETTQIPLPLEE